MEIAPLAPADGTIESPLSWNAARVPYAAANGVGAEDSAHQTHPVPRAVLADASAFAMRLPFVADRRKKPRDKLVRSSTGVVNMFADVAVLFVVTAIATLASRQGGSTATTATLVAFQLAIGAFWLLAGAIFQQFSASAYQRDAAEDVAVTSILLLGVTFCLAIATVLHADGRAAPRIAEFVVLAWPTIVLARLCAFRSLARREGPFDDVLIVGNGSLARCTAEDLRARGRHRVAGYVTLDDQLSSVIPKDEVLGSAPALENLLRTRPVQEVYIAADLFRESAPVRAAIAVCERVGVPFALPACGLGMERARPLARRAVSDGYLHYHSIEPKPFAMAVKRVLDILLSAGALVVLSPLVLASAIVIKATSRGPIFFHQHRVGLYGLPFDMLKFRSMVTNAEQLRETLIARNERRGPVFKIRDDPRATPIGRFLRAYSIDELPQLLNVLRGEMSIVGPRPPIPSEVAKYEPWQRRRLSMRPGLTCLWQVSPERHQITFDRWMYLDMQYIDHWTLKEDFRLICRTIPVVLQGSGRG